MNELSDLVHLVRAFRDAREWGQFHTPRQLAAALAIEAAELQEVLLWRTDAEVEVALGEGAPVRERLAEELGDVLIYAFLLADRLGLEPAAVVRRKLALNEVKYPVDKARGRATKHDALSAE
jgi:dCTP diphosphatase